MANKSEAKILYNIFKSAEKPVEKFREAALAGEQNKVKVARK
jgi:hypothetical protein